MGDLIQINNYKGRKRYRSRKGLAWNRSTDGNKVIKFRKRKEYPLFEEGLIMPGHGLGPGGDPNIIEETVDTSLY